MNFKNITLTLALAAVSVALIPTSLRAKEDPTVTALGKYVTPGNAPERPAAWTYMADDLSYAMLSADHKKVTTYDLATGKEKEVIFDVERTRETTLASIEGFKISPDGTQILVWTDSEPVYRRSSTARYYVYERRSRLMRPLSTQFERQQAPVLSPNGRMCAFMAPDNNIYIKKLDYNTEVAVTTDGAKNKILNGVPDWTYEEEFTTTCSMVFSEDCETFCFLKYNETKVPMYNMPIYQGACDPQDQYELYPGTFSYKYPVSGQPNSVVTLHSYDVSNRKVKDIPLPDNNIEYIPRIEFAPNGSLMAVTLNREQNRMDIYSVNPKATTAKSIYTEESKAWIIPEMYTLLTFNKDGFVIISPRSGYNQAYQYSYGGSLMREITKGKHDLTDYYGTDKLGNHYYQMAAPTPKDRTVYRVSPKNEVKALTPEGGTSVAQFSPNRSFMMLNYSSVTKPPVYTLCRNDGKALRTLEDNAKYATRYTGLPKKEFFSFTSKDGVELMGWMIKPTNFNPSTKYPVIMYQYSGPGSQEVLDRWKMDWDYYYAHEQGYVVMCVDGRGTGGRGIDFCQCVYCHLGYFETLDQIAAADYAKSLPFVDAKRIGIFGWSYGGYETLMCAQAKNSPFAAACAVAPVTSWRYYDTVYTERYMLTPNMNEGGYHSSSPINYTADLKCPLMIMYGTADDNVHPSNSLEYAARLQLQGTLFDMMVFTNKNHSIYGCTARAVVYANMLRFFNQHLK